MNLLLLTYHAFDSQSAIHIFHFANELMERGVQCTVAVPDRPETVRLIGSPRFSCTDFEQARNGHFGFPDARSPDLIHAWTPREIVRRMVEPLALRHRCPYVVHLEDNELVLAADAFGTTPEALSRCSEARLDEIVPLHLSHPSRARNFIARAAAITAIIDRLLELKPDGIPAEIIWPSYSEPFADIPAANIDLRKRLGLADDSFVVVYPGNVHSSNVEEVRSLYLAILLLNRRGYDAKLVRIGVDHVPLFDHDPDPDKTGRIELGFRPISVVAEVLSVADALVQPGSANAFNDYRLPAKLPEFLISGRPVLLPYSNIGRHLEDGVNCLHLRTGTAVEIANTLSTLIEDPERRRRIGRAGREFAVRELSWTRGAEKLHRLYSGLLDRAASSPPPASVSAPIRPPEAAVESIPRKSVCRTPTIGILSDVMLEAVAQRYRGRPVPALGYGTVRDFCDSMDRMPKFASANRDLKDCQRPWVLKAILGALPRGGKLLEIGAGEPLLADLLRRLGYEVWVVDPYDGSANGPKEFERFVTNYPALHFVRQAFTSRLDTIAPGSFDGIYSVSVLEHIALDALASVFGGIRRFLTPDGVTIHAVDHVLKGNTADYSLAHIQKVGQLTGFGSSDIHDLLRRLQDDVDAYYLSAESHNMWRGTLPYDDFPMRACVSIQFSVGAASLTGSP